MKKKLLLLCLTCAITFCTNAQDFFPANFNALYNINKVNGDTLSFEINNTYLNQKNYFIANDSVYVKNDSAAVLVFRSLIDNKSFGMNIQYYLPDTDLKNFIQRCKDGGLKQSALNNNLFEGSSEKYVGKIQITKNAVWHNKSYSKITFTFTENKFDQNGKAYPWRRTAHLMNRSFPYQNTSWHFDSEHILKKEPNDYMGDKRITSLHLSNNKHFINKIEFIDDVNFKITFGKQQKTLKGTYDSYYNNTGFIERVISFRINITEKPTPPSKSGLEPLKRAVPAFEDLQDLKKDTEAYIIRLFNDTYKIRQYEQGNLLLENEKYLHYPILAPAPSTPKKQ